MNSTFAIEVTDVPQSTSSKSIYIEGSFAETDIKPRCSNYKEYMKLDITMCDSSALEITQIYSSVRYGLKFSYAQEKQEIGFASLFQFNSTVDTNFECTNVTYSIVNEGYETLFKVNNTIKTFEIDIT